MFFSKIMLVLISISALRKLSNKFDLNCNLIGYYPMDSIHVKQKLLCLVIIVSCIELNVSSLVFMFSFKRVFGSFLQSFWVFPAAACWWVSTLWSAVRKWNFHTSLFNFFVFLFFSLNILYFNVFLFCHSVIMISN